MKFKDLSFTIEEFTATRVEVYYSKESEMWVVQQFSPSGYLIDSPDYRYQKSEAVTEATKQMAESETIIQVSIFTKAGNLQKTIEGADHK